MNEAVKRILQGTIYMTIATASGDGAPWNVPVRFAFDEAYIYFRSPVGTTHGANIARDGRVSAVIFDTSQKVKGAVYIHSSTEKVDDADESVAIEVFSERFNNPSQQWDRTEYYRFRIGILDTIRSRGEMYYFQV